MKSSPMKWRHVQAANYPSTREKNALEMIWWQIIVLRSDTLYVIILTIYFAQAHISWGRCVCDSVCHFKLNICSALLFAFFASLLRPPSDSHQTYYRISCEFRKFFSRTHNWRLKFSVLGIKENDSIKPKKSVVFVYLLVEFRFLVNSLPHESDFKMTKKCRIDYHNGWFISLEKYIFIWH